MTSYQNVSESEIKGYNDCPVLDYKQTSSTTSLKTRRRLVSQNMVMGQAPSASASNSSLSSMNGLPMPIPSALRTASLKKIAPSASLQKVAAVSSESASVSNDELLSKLTEILGLDSTLPEREFKHYEKRLLDQFNKGLPNEAHKSVVLNALENYQNKAQVKNDLIIFMLANDGNSSWCLPLRKVLENIKA